MRGLELLAQWLVDLFSPDRVVCRFANETGEDDE